MTVTIPAMPELSLTAIKKQLSTRILECDKGGFIVVFEGHGIAAMSTWGDAINAIEDAGYDIMGLPKPEPFPNVLHEPRPEPRSNVVHSVILAAIIAVTAILNVISVKIT